MPQIKDPELAAQIEAVATAVAAKLNAAVPAAPLERRLAQTEEGRMQRLLVLVILIAAALSGMLEWLHVDATPAYSLMAAASTALLGNAGLGAARQMAKAKTAEAEKG